MDEKCFKVTREDGVELGVFDRRDEAERRAEYEAASRGYGLSWTQHYSGAHGMPTTSGRGVFGYKIDDVECD